MNTHMMLLMLLCIALGQSGALARSDLSCNVMLTSYRDIQAKDAFGKTGCMTRVERARQVCGSSVIGILPYQTFLYTWKNQGGKNVAYMTGIKYADARGGVGPGRGEVVLKQPNAGLIAKFQRGMTECLLHAAKVGFTTIVITPHLNAPRNQLWRNLLAFQPFENYGGITYKAAIISPLVAASKAAIAKGVKVRLALQGEMNMAIAMYPQQWTTLVKETKAALGPLGKVGVSMNWNKVCGEFCNFYPGWLFPQKQEYKNLMWAVDFVGVSSYPSVASYATTGKMDLDASMRQLDSEMKNFIGFGLTSLTKSGKQLQWSEFGVGGGCDSSASCAASDLGTMAKFTYAMVAGPYGRFRDPWAPQWAKNFRYAFHQQAIRKLNSNSGWFPISYAFVWSTGSMDVCAVDPDSATKQGSFYSPSICTMMRNYNSKGIVP